MYSVIIVVKPKLPFVVSSPDPDIAVFVNCQGVVETRVYVDYIGEV